VSGLLSQAALIVATSDLMVVQLLTQAIRIADLSSQHNDAPSDIPFRDRIGPAAIADFRYSQDRCCCPSTENRPADECASNKPFPPIIYRPARPSLRGDTPRVAEPHHPLSVTPTESPIQPPWKVLPWENPPPPAQTVKIHPHTTDVIQKGMLLDLFV
jgi:hypothetical protein